MMNNATEFSYGIASPVGRALAGRGAMGAVGDGSAWAQAQALFDSALRTPWSAWVQRLRSRSCVPLPVLAESEMSGRPDRHDAGIQTVPIRCICGSESPGAGFDRNFRPLHEHQRDRWVSVAAARLRGMRLPPVELIAVGQAYYVRDGHHRISVARALGEEFIEASVTVW